MITIDMKLFSWLAPVEMLKIKKRTTEVVRQKQSMGYRFMYRWKVNENDKIRAILSSDNKDEYIEQKAREKGYAKEGEIVFYDISSNR